MPVLYGLNVHTLGPGQRAVYRAWVDGEPESGGVYQGPVVVTAVPERLNQRLVTSHSDIRFTARLPDGLSSKCFYELRIGNTESFPVSFKLHCLVG